MHRARKEKPTKILISLPSELIEALDLIAETQSYSSRTELIREIVRNRVRTYLEEAE